jgi:5-methylcytosine-specific restriction protein B
MIRVPTEKLIKREYTPKISLETDGCFNEDIFFMARKAGAELIYEVAQLFRKRCLESSESLLWLDTHAWTAENMQKLWHAFVDNPDVSKRSFYEKWEDQLAGESEDVHKIAADVTAFYYLFPYDIGKEQKLERVGRVIGWKLSSTQPDLSAIERAYDEHIGSTGRMYFSRIPEQIAFFLAFAQAIRAGKANPNDAQASKRLADEISKGIKTSQAGRNVLLHLLFPDDFERIASQSHKLEIVEYFADLAEGATDVDEALKKIRETLANGDPNFDFYQPDIKKRWH